MSQCSANELPASLRGLPEIRDASHAAELLALRRLAVKAAAAKEADWRDNLNRFLEQGRTGVNQFVNNLATRKPSVPGGGLQMEPWKLPDLSAPPEHAQFWRDSAWEAARNAGIGAGIGAGMGGLSSLAKPKRSRNVLRDSLTGALLGGSVGGLGSLGYRGGQLAGSPPPTALKAEADAKLRAHQTNTSLDQVRGGTDAALALLDKDTWAQGRALETMGKILSPDKAQVLVEEPGAAIAKGESPVTAAPGGAEAGNGQVGIGGAAIGGGLGYAGARVLGSPLRNLERMRTIASNPKAAKGLELNPTAFAAAAGEAVPNPAAAGNPNAPALARQGSTWSRFRQHLAGRVPGGFADGRTVGNRVLKQHANTITPRRITYGRKAPVAAALLGALIGLNSDQQNNAPGN